MSFVYGFTNKVLRRSLPLFVLLCVFALCIGSAQAQSAGQGVWLEGEAPTSITPANLKPNITGWGHAEYLSGGKWLQFGFEAEKADVLIPDSGIVLSYNFTVSTNAAYEVWNRIGYEFVRSPFDWRIDDGTWHTITPNDLTTDLMELQDWNEVAWLKMGTQSLSAGAHTLQIRLAKTKDDKGKTARILYASDALTITSTPFRPNGKVQPGDTHWQTDQDRAAAAHVFAFPSTESAAQTALSLKGDWQIARYDEPGAIIGRTEPIMQQPADADLFWHGIAVPGDRNTARPDLAYCHRYFLRTRVNVPGTLAGKSFYLHLPSVNLIASVFVNGQLCGTTDIPFALWDCDVTKAIKPGQVNEIWVGIKDTYYGFVPTDTTGRSGFNVPLSFLHYNTYHLDYPVLGHFQNGILQEPSLVAAGSVYTSDVFAIPSVQHKTLGLEVTVHNPTAQPATVQVENEVVPLTGGAAEKTFALQDLQIPAGQEATLKLSEAWANPKLWWPDSPQQYTVLTHLRLAGKEIDTRTTKFGFREWGWKGSTFSLNGIPWHGRADLVDYSTQNPEGAVKTWRQHGQNMQRLWTEDGWGGMDMEHALDFFDSHGVPIRRTGIFDGESAGYTLTQQVQQNGKDVTVANRALFEHWFPQLRAWARGQRNHPSIFVWSMENEITFINANVTGVNEYTDPQMRKAAEMLAALDPTRPQMTDGGNALLDQSLPIYGGHYLETDFRYYPEEAYTLKRMHTAGSPGNFQRWPITQQKPILIGESYFATGVEPAAFASIAGEAPFLGKANSYPAMGLMAKMLSEGYRWSGVSFHFWMGDESSIYYKAWQPLAVLCRQWDWSFASGQKVPRTLGIFNDTFHDAAITLTWKLRVGGKPVATQTSLHRIAAGSNDKFAVTLPMPVVGTRQEGTWTLALSVDGKPVFEDTKAVSVFPAAVAASPSPSVRLASTTTNPSSSRLLVYDPSGAVPAFLRSRAIPFTALAGLATLPATGKVLIIGRDALDVAASTSSRLSAYASEGRTVIVLEQKHPLKYQGLPGEMKTDTNEGRIAFAEDAEHPVLRGLQQKDFFTWGPDGLLYRNAYAKPTSGGKSLIECDYGLQDTALAEMTVGKGALLVSQLLIGEKLSSNPVAQQLLLNMLTYGAQYKQTTRPALAAANDAPLLLKALDTTGLQYTKESDPLQLLRKPGSIAILPATPANLQKLAENLSLVHSFTQAGGWIVFNNLTPEGLQSYNKLVGVDHLLRPFQREKVSFPPVRSPLTAGLATSNIVMYSGQQIFDFAAGQYVASDAFSYVVDLDDIAPFGKSSFFAYSNIVNNFVGSDGWPLIIDFPMPGGGKPYDIPITLPRPETITEFTWVGSANYEPATRVNLIFDGKDKLSFATKPNEDPQTFAISPPRTAKEVTLEIAEFESIPAKQSDGKDLSGIGNIYLKVKRSPDFARKVRPMLNIGAMVEYPQGNGGIVLCNVLLKETETVPENADKKRAILAAILRNLHAPFSGGKTVIAGATNLRYQPLDLSKQANQYRTDRGWFGDKNFTFTDLPTGKHTFADVPYVLYDVATSPVPTVVMLGGNGIPGNLPDHVTGIPVHQKADALFFLQSARIDARRYPDEVKQNKAYEMADYIIHYADGQTVKVPILSEINVDDYRQKTPQPLPGAQIAWTRPYTGTQDSAVAYTMQWNNPRPGVAIESIDLVYGPDRRGVPVLLAVTAATAE